MRQRRAYGVTGIAHPQRNASAVLQTASSRMGSAALPMGSTGFGCEAEAQRRVRNCRPDSSTKAFECLGGYPLDPSGLELTINI